jgi:hypothetical protein
VFHAPYANFAKVPEVEAFAKGGSGRVSVARPVRIAHTISVAAIYQVASTKPRHSDVANPKRLLRTSGTLVYIFQTSERTTILPLGGAT